MKISFNKKAQSGFTLIELIVVIVILGILAATALPKFSGLNGDARIASLNAVKGSLASTSAMLHGRALINPNPQNGVFQVEGGINVPMGTTGYANASTELAAAAGLSTDDYTVADEGTVLKITPKSVPSALATTCHVTYTEAASANAAPVIALANNLKCE
ncbi:type II secretion system protein [Massilia timonae]|uniref:Prepilin-type N-terminal cleavage/methylation domain protein n=1 Tax=Massilia timonae TaxID=47229 RepID=A0A1S2N9D4_9BURK|nr:type II secretion system protein [Massilia timonae]OIJ41687.1 hypothetical protein LO55_4438 [Massilia timonae]